MYERTKLLCDLTGMSLPMLALALGKKRYTEAGWSIPLADASRVADQLHLTPEQRAELAASYQPRNEWERLRFAKLLTLRQAAKLAGVSHALAFFYEKGEFTNAEGYRRYRNSIGFADYLPKWRKSYDGKWCLGIGMAVAYKHQWWLCTQPETKHTAKSLSSARRAAEIALGLAPCEVCDD